MSIFFFDTCALVPRYKTGPFSYRVNRVFGSPNPVYISEMTIVEIVSALASICRDKKLPEFEFEKMKLAFWKDVDDGRIAIKNINPRDMMLATHLLSLAGIVNRRNLGSLDAMVAVGCRELALEMGKRVTFYTKDWTLYSTLYQINAYRSALKMRYLGKGKGGIPPSSG